ncbi:MAG: ATP-grasp domain-containing protein [Coriobacteriia bacterium]
MPTRRHVLVVGCGFPQLGLIRAAKRRGYEVTGADLNPGATGVPEVDHFLQASTGDVGAICSAYRESGAQGIATSGSELALTTTAHAAERLDLPFYADTETVYRCQAKDAMRAGYRAAGLEVPFFESCKNVQEARDFVQRVGLPVVVKPAHGWGQRGVSRVDALEYVDQAFEHAAKSSHGGGGAVLEACVVGHEMSVNGWVEDGELVSYCVTDREVFPGNRPLGVMRSEITPSSAEDALVERAVSAARAGARALGLVRGPCYSQVAVSHEKAVLFETAARLGGGFDADVTRLACGVDLYARLLGVAFEDAALEREGKPHASKPALVRFLAPRAGQLQAIEGLNRVKAMPGVVDAAVYPQPGDILEPMRHAAHRVAHILVTGATRSEAVERADAAESQLRLVIHGSAS